jgi:primosomal protein N'
MALIQCPECEKQISSQAESCPHCGNPMATSIKCPTCKSANIHKISTGSKVGSAIMFGVFSVGKLTKTFQCNDCRYRW